MKTELQREKPMYVVLSRGDDTPAEIVDRLRGTAGVPPLEDDAV
ncbi:hypothetical protein ABIE44_003563 [Marmoricola sp. OAE513]